MPDNSCSPLAGQSAGDDSLATQTRLRRTAEPRRSRPPHHPGDTAGQGRAKFGDFADRMYFTPDGLEQATRLRVAEHRAARLVASSART